MLPSPFDREVNLLLILLVLESITLKPYNQHIRLGRNQLHEEQDGLVRL